MADNIDVNVNVNTSQANRNLDNLNNRIGTLNRSFSALKTALGGIAFGGLIANNLRFAASMVDVSNSTDIALKAVVGFSRAVQDNGGSLEDAQNALQKFNVSIGEAAQGSASAQEAFRKVGVSINDLRTLSQEDLLRKTIEGLNQISDASLRAKLQTELLGKAFRGVDLKGLANDYDDAIRNSAKYVASIKTADQTQQKLEKSITDLRLVLLGVIEPLASLANKIDVTSESFARFINAAKNIITVLFAIFGIFVPLVRVFTAVRAGMSAVTIATTTLSKEFSRFFGNIKGWFTNFSKVGKIISDGIEKATKKIKTANDATVVKNAKKRLGYWKTLSDHFETLKTSATKAALAIATTTAALIGYNEKPKFDARDFGAREAGAEDTGIRFPGVAEEAMAKRDIIVATEKLTTAIANNAQAFIKQKEATLSALQAGASYVLMSEEAKAILEAQRNVYDDFNNKIEEYQDKISELLPEQEDLRNAYLAQIEILKKTRDAQMTQAADAVIATQRQIDAQKDLQAELQRTFEQYRADTALADLQAELDLIGLENDELEKQQRLLTVQQEMRDKILDAMQGLIDLEQRKGTLSDEQYQREKSNLEQQLELARQVAEGKLQIDQEYFKRKQELEESYNAGAEKALSDIAEQFKPINMAQEAVKKGWDSIGNAIDEFAETGKFKFSDFARSILLDLTKMIAKALIFRAIASLFGGAGIPIPGLAKGGPAKAGQPYMVGEKGPELFIPKSAGTVIPNNKLGATEGVATGAVNAPVTNTYNTYNISAIDSKSVAQFFYENRKTMFGTMTMARKELPYAVG